MTTVLTVEGLHKSYLRRRERTIANNGVTLSVAAGEVHGLLGHNGAGKTTLVNQVVGLARPDSGRITIGDCDAVADPRRARLLASVQSQGQVPLGGLTPRQAVGIVGRLRGASGAEVGERADRLFAALDIAQWADTIGPRLSGGVTRLVGFVMAAVVPGMLVVLDEPTNDVDPVRRRSLWRCVRGLADEGVAVLLVSHNVNEADRVADRLTVLAHGAVIAAGTPAELKATVSGEMRMEIVVGAGDEPDLPEFVAGADREGRLLRVRVVARDAAAAVTWAQRHVDDGTVEEFSLAPVSLEDAYVMLGDPGVRTGKENADASA